MKNSPSVDRLRELLVYVPETGELFWKERQNEDGRRGEFFNV